MKWSVIFNALPYLLEAAGTTLWVSLLGMVLGQVLGAALCIGRVAGGRLLARFGALYVSFFRGVPLLVLLLLVYYLLPFVGLDVPPLVAAVSALGLSSAAYVSEIFRGSLNAVPRSQTEAAAALGFPPTAIWRRILLPQALRISLPALINELILLLKASSLISMVGVAELTRTGHSFAAATYRQMEIYLTVACIYLVMNLALAALGGLVERRLAHG
jgi:polar amino acid transport system permease protein